MNSESGKKERWPALRELWRALFPSLCLLCDARCREETSRRLCPACLAKIALPPPPLCPRCGRPQEDALRLCPECYLTPPPFLAHRSRYQFAEPISTLIHRAKGSGDRLALAALLELLPPLPVFSPEAAAWAAVVAVPARAADVRRRGLDAAYLLAGEAARLLSAPFRPDLLHKNRVIAAQKTLRREERKTNVLGAFSASAAALPRGAILVVDDIYTTGATLRECVKALRQVFPERSVFAFSLAQVPAVAPFCPARKELI